MVSSIFRFPAVALMGLCIVASSCDSGPTLEESLAAQQDESKQLPEDYKPDPKPRPKGLEGPTEAEFKAWNRKDPEGEKHLYKWDKAHLSDMLRYWEHLECFREKVREEGDKAFGAEPGSPTEEQWYQFKRAFVTHVDGWQKRLFAEQPRILEKSKFIGNFLEAHELVMHGYLKAYNEGDKTQLEKNDAHWIIVEAKVKKYVKQLGGEFPERDPNDAKAMEKHAEVCEDAMTPPDRTGKAKRRKRKKGAI
jgi:hypothetical protein